MSQWRMFGEFEIYNSRGILWPLALDLVPLHNQLPFKAYEIVLYRVRLMHALRTLV